MRPAEPTLDRIGEVLEASTTAFRAGCDELHCSPPFGSLVRSSNGDHDVLGLVYDVSTDSIDPGRPPVVRGKGNEDEASVYRRHPQLEQLLRTDFQAIVVGSIENGVVRQRLPERPPRLHAFVWPVGDEIQRTFFSQLDYLTLLTATSVAAPVDELIAASLRRSGQDDEFLVRAGKELVVLLRGEASRLNAIFRRMRE